MLAAAVVAIQAWRMGLAAGQNSPQIQVVAVRQNVSALTTRTSPASRNGPPLLVVTNDGRELNHLLTDHKDAAYQLGRDYLEKHFEADAVEIWIPLPNYGHGWPGFEPIYAFELQRTESGYKWGYSAGVTNVRVRSYERDHIRTGPDE